MDALTLLLLRGDGEAARESWLEWMLRGFAAGIHCVLEVRSRQSLSWDSANTG